MKLITEVNDILEVKQDTTNDKRHWYLEGIFMQSEVKNRNGRIYPRNVMESGVTRYVGEKMTNKTSYGELGHPQGPTINPERISHLITDLRFEGNDVVGKARILDTQYGLIAQKILEGGGRLGMSSRAMGSLKEQNGVMVVQEDFHIATAADIVTDPSAPQAMVNGIMEDVDWFYDNIKNEWFCKTIDKHHSNLKVMSREQRENAALMVFESLMKSFTNGK